MQGVEIHGTGVAGMLAALALEDRFSVTLVGSRPPRASNGLEIVDSGFVNALTSLGLAPLWQTMVGRIPISGIRSAWHGQDDIPWADSFRPGNGRHAIERQMLERALATMIDSRPSIERAAAPPRTTSAFVIDATGRAAMLARRFGARPRPIAKLVGHVGHGEGRELTSPIVEPGSSGWWFVSGSTDRATAILFTQGKLEGGRKEWDDALASAPLVRRRFIPTAETHIASVPASSRYLVPSCAAHWAAVGDAALSRDPLSSDGLGFAARSVLLLRSCLTAKGFDADVYDRQVGLEIARYRIARQRYYRLMADQLGGSFWVSQAKLISAMTSAERCPAS